MFSLSHNFLFVHIPRTGGNSIQQVIRHCSEDQLIGGKYPDAKFRDGINRFEVSGPYTRFKHDSLSKYHGVVPPDLFDRVFKFCSVRNPWSRAISFYFSPRRWLKKGVDPHWSRSEFIAALENFPPMVEVLKIDGQVWELDFVVRFEQIESDVARVLELLGIPPGAHALPHVNKGHARDYRQYFDGDDDLISLVGERYAEDIEQFGYRFDT